jgi:hypothetical protein
VNGSEDRSAQVGIFRQRLGTSARGEEIWAHCNDAGRILEIEFLSDDKPCQVDDGTM